MRIEHNNHYKNKTKQIETYIGTHTNQDQWFHLKHKQLYKLLTKQEENKTHKFSIDENDELFREDKSWCIISKPV